MPSLRDRSEDIPLLINELVRRMEAENRGNIRFSWNA
jgi:sigma-54 specific flagellar transcriptional regulator A